MIVKSIQVSRADLREPSVILLYTDCYVFLFSSSSRIFFTLIKTDCSYEQYILRMVYWHTYNVNVRSV